jgi:hypothetical protein
MGFLSNLLGGGGNETQTTITSPWSGLQPYLSGTGGQPGLFQGAANQFRAGPQSYYPNQTYAGFDPLQSQSQQMGIDYANSGLNGMLPATMGSYQNVVSGGLMSPDSNPYMQANISSMADQVKQNMAGGYNANADAAQNAGQFGSSRHAITDYLTNRNANEVIGRNTNEMLMGGYNSGLNAMMQAQGNAGQMAQLGMAPSNLLSTIGGERQGMAQNAITDQFNAYNFNQQAPWQNLQNYAGILGGNYMGSGGNSTVPVTGNNPLMGALGGAATGASFGGPLGAGIGGAIGFLANR